MLSIRIRIRIQFRKCWFRTVMITTDLQPAPSTANLQDCILRANYWSVRSSIHTILNGEIC
jgi:hypothetical protein